MPDDRLPKPDERLPKPDDRRRAFRSVLTYASPHVADVPLVAELGSSCFASRTRELHGRWRATPAVRARCAISRGRSDDRRRAFRSVLTYASPHVADVPLLRRWVPPASLPGRGSPTGGDARPPRSARGVRCARARGAAPRAARGGGGPLAPLGAARLRRANADVPAAVADVGCCALRTRELHGRYARLPRYTRGDAWAPRHGLGAIPQPPSSPKGAWGRNLPNCAPIPSHSHTITSRKPHAPPARAARPRRPLAPPVRAARSRRTLAPSARAAASLHRRRTLMVSLGFPIPSHLHTIASRHPKAPSHAGMIPP